MIEPVFAKMIQKIIDESETKEEINTRFRKLLLNYYSMELERLSLEVFNENALSYVRRTGER